MTVRSVCLCYGVLPRVGLRIGATSDAATWHTTRNLDDLPMATRALVVAGGRPGPRAAHRVLDGHLQLEYCTACAQYHHCPRTVCPFCSSEKTEWREAEGSGTVYTYAIQRRAGPEPFCVAYVTLDEGPSVPTSIVDCDPWSVRIGQRVRVVFKPTENGTRLPMFTPARPAACRRARGRRDERTAILR